VIQVDLNNAPTQIVIVGEITDTTGPYQVKISQSVPFDSSNHFPPVSGAFVTISDNSRGQTDTLTESDPGIYNSHFLQGVSGNVYALNVVIGNNHYDASSIMPHPVPFDSIGFQNTFAFGGKRVISAIPYFQDPPELTNYYQFIEYINGEKRNKTFVFDDRLSDGKYFSRPLRDDSAHLQIGDNLLINMYCIDKNTFDYLNTFDQLSDIDNSTPANPVSNISNGALGYFSAHTVKTKQVAVH